MFHEGICPQVHFYLPWYIKESAIYTSKLYCNRADEAEEDAGEYL